MGTRSPLGQRRTQIYVTVSTSTPWSIAMIGGNARSPRKQYRSSRDEKESIVYTRIRIDINNQLLIYMKYMNELSKIIFCRSAFIIDYRFSLYHLWCYTFPGYY